MKKNKKIILSIIFICDLIVLSCFICCKINCIKGEKIMSKNENINTVFEEGEKNPYGEFFTGQTYLKMLVEKDDIFNSQDQNKYFF